MKTLARICSLLLFPLLICAASGQTVSFTASNISVGGTKLTAGQLCATPVDVNNRPLLAGALGGTVGGAVTYEASCTPVTTGAISGYSLPDTALTTPANMCLRVTVADTAQNGRIIYTAPCVQPASSGQTSWCTTTGGATTCNFDKYTPASAAIAPVIAPTLAAGTVTTGAPGSSAAASVTGSSPHYTLNLTLPAGAAGPNCDVASPAGECDLQAVKAASVVAPTIYATSTPASGGLAFGDSTMNGAFSANAPGDGGHGPVYWMNQNTPGGFTDKAQDGDYATDIGQLWMFPLGPWCFGQAPRFVLHTGLNDRNHVTTNQQAIFQAAHMADLTRLLIPCESIVLPGNGLITKTGTWAYNTTRIGASSPTFEDATNGDTLTIGPIVTTGAPLILWYEQLDSNAGAATVTVDGTATGTTLNSGNAGTTGNCICTGRVTQAPLAARIPLAAGSHTVTLTVTGATGSGMGFSLIGIGSTGMNIPTTRKFSGGPPQVWVGGAQLDATYAPGGSSDTIDAIVQSNVHTLQTDGLKAYYVCGITGDYASFPTSPIQPLGCSDTSSYYLDNTYMHISTTAYDGTSLLTVVMTAAIPATVHVGDTEIIALTTTKTSISNTSYWNVQSKSGSTLVLSQPGFSASSWTATSDTGIVSAQLYSDPHPNSNGYYQVYKAYNHAMNLPGGSAAQGTAIAANFNKSAVSTSITMDGTQPILELNCDGSQTVTLDVPTSNGPFILLNYGSVGCAVTHASGVGQHNVPLVLPPTTGWVLHTDGSNWWNDGATPGSATILNLAQTTTSTDITIDGTASIVQVNCSGTQTITVSSAPAYVGFIGILNFGTGTCALAHQVGASLDNIPSVLPSKAAMIIHATGGGANWWLDSATFGTGTTLDLAQFLTSSSVTIDGSTSVVQVACSGTQTITLAAAPAKQGPVTVSNTGAGTCAVAAAGGTALNNVPTILLPATSMTIHSSGGTNWYLDSGGGKLLQNAWMTTAGVTSPTANNTYYAGLGGIGTTATVGNVLPFIAPAAAILTSVNFYVSVGATKGTVTVDNLTCSIWDTDASAIVTGATASVPTTGATNTITVSGLSGVITSGHHYVAKCVTPASWTTQPTSIQPAAQAFFRF